MRGRKLLMFALCIVTTMQAANIKEEQILDLKETGISDNITEDFQTSRAEIVTGSTILGFQFIGIPVLSRYFNWKTPIAWANPFGNIKETEPYLQDKVWHFVGAAASTELNYMVLSRYFGLEDPVLEAAGLSLLFWTVMECLDGLTGAGFSFRDQAGNTLGAAFGALKIVRPDIPLYVRVGVEDWGRFVMFAASGFDRTQTGTDFYSIFKTELIYVFDNDFYVGVGLTKGEGKKNYHDRYGVTVGYDLFRSIEEKNDSWVSRNLTFFRDYVTLSIGVTWWLDRVRFSL